MGSEGKTHRSAVIANDLTPPEAEAVRMYTDPLSPAYGKKGVAAVRAGAPDTMWAKVGVQRALEQIELERQERGHHVSAYLSHNAADAAFELVQQLSAGRDLDIVDPRGVIDDIVEKVSARVHEAVATVDGLDEDTIGEVVTNAMDAAMKQQRMLLGEINTANRVALAAVKERRAAVEMILAYHMGTPQQKVKLEGELTKGEENILDLSQLTDDELDQMRAGLDDVLRMRTT